jgi:hypothetical protein
MLKSNSKYYYSRLDNATKRIYSSILSAFETRNPNPSFMVNPLRYKVDIPEILNYISSDNPGLFYVDFSKIFINTSLTWVSLRANFLYSNQQIDATEKRLEAVIAKIFASRGGGFASMDAYNRELTLHDSLVRNISYSNTGINHETTSIVGALLSRSAVCEGYAKAFKLLCDRADLPCIVVSGKGIPIGEPEEPHAWNIVKVDGVCAHVDVTWDSTTRGNSDTCYDHFNLTDDDTAKDHTWNRSLLPACTSDVNNYYVRKGQCVGNRTDFKNYVAEQAKRGEKAITFRLTGKEKTMDQVMDAVQETLQRVLKYGYSVNLRYNNTRGTGLISLR